MADKSKHAFGALERIDESIASGILDAYDILFVKDANDNPYIGWIDKDGNKVILHDKTQIVRVEELPTANGDENVIYVYNNEGYIWDSVNSQCVSISKSADLTTLETQVSNIQTQMEDKVDAATVQSMINAAVDDSSSEVVEF